MTSTLPIECPQRRVYAKATEAHDEQEPTREIKCADGHRVRYEMPRVTDARNSELIDKFQVRVKRRLCSVQLNPRNTLEADKIMTI